MTLSLYNQLQVGILSDHASAAKALRYWKVTQLLLWFDTSGQVWCSLHGHFVHRLMQSSRQLGFCECYPHIIAIWQILQCSRLLVLVDLNKLETIVHTVYRHGSNLHAWALYCHSNGNLLPPCSPTISVWCFVPLHFLNPPNTYWASSYTPILRVKPCVMHGHKQVCSIIHLWRLCTFKESTHFDRCNLLCKTSIVQERVESCSIHTTATAGHASSRIVCYKCQAHLITCWKPTLSV